ncbi:MAG TPA: noncanonical pyrimidine nucleotidase, YjjG family [Oceanospirillales bacterium]|nr:noncanonical pyrimidine nucleotidase, YjjG family [Oceanospirillales bacterium]
MHNQINNYKWLIFDADNTLFDYDAAEKNALLKTLDDANIAYQRDTIIPIYHKINHKLWMQFETGEIKSQAEIKQKRTQQLFAILNAKSDCDAFANDYIINLSNNAQLLKNALMVIAKLATTHKLIIMTNGMTSVQVPRFERSPIIQYFQHIIISEQIGYSKPSKQIFSHAFELMNQPAKAEVLMIGDNLGSDVQGGINYGIDTIWYNPHRKKVQHNATYEVNDLLEFIKPFSRTPI